jgi:hypothetical protein
MIDSLRTTEGRKQRAELRGQRGRSKEPDAGSREYRKQNREWRHQTGATNEKQKGERREQFIEPYIESGKKRLWSKYHSAQRTADNRAANMCS